MPLLPPEGHFPSLRPQLPAATSTQQGPQPPSKASDHLTRPVTTNLLLALLSRPNQPLNRLYLPHQPRATHRHRITVSAPQKTRYQTSPNLVQDHGPRQAQRANLKQLKPRLETRSRVPLSRNVGHGLNERQRRGSGLVARKRMTRQISLQLQSRQMIMKRHQVKNRKG